MKRWVLIPILAGLSITATGCPEPAPAGWRPPVVDSVVVEPTTIMAGDAFTMTAVVTDVKSVQSVDFGLYTGEPGVLEVQRYLECERDPFVAGAAVTVVARCQMPADAPLGGWNAVVRATDFEYLPSGPQAAGSKLTSFTVVSGPDPA